VSRKKRKFATLEPISGYKMKIRSSPLNIIHELGGAKYKIKFSNRVNELEGKG